MAMLKQTGGHKHHSHGHDLYVAALYRRILMFDYDVQLQDWCGMETSNLYVH